MCKYLEFSSKVAVGNFAYFFSLKVKSIDKMWQKVFFTKLVIKPLSLCIIKS